MYVSEIVGEHMFTIISFILSNVKFSKSLREKTVLKWENDVVFLI